MADILIEIENISLSRNDNNILKDISFKIEKSKALNLYGLNGSGKTSLLSIIMGLTEPTSGSIKNNSDDESFYEKVVYIGHKYGIKGNLTVEENLLYSAVDNLDDKFSSVNQALEIYNMKSLKDILTKYLSHGQQKKVSLMKTLITDSLLWIIDEPYSALDNNSIRIFNSTVKDFLKKGGSLLMTSHTELNKSSFEINNYKLK